MAVTLVASVKMYAGETPSANPYFSTLSAVSLSELPAKSAALVTKADAKNRVEATIDVVKAAVGLNPAAAVAIVGAIAKSVPEMASVAAGTAVTLVPDQAVAIARAAAAAAPSEAGKIVEAVAHVPLLQYPHRSECNNRECKQFSDSGCVPSSASLSFWTALRSTNPNAYNCNPSGFRWNGSARRTPIRKSVILLALFFSPFFVRRRRAFFILTRYPVGLNIDPSRK